MDLDQLAWDLVDIYDDIDPWGQWDAYDSKDEAFQTALYSLRKWSAEDIRCSIIEPLKGYAADGLADNSFAMDIVGRLEELAKERD